MIILVVHEKEIYFVSETNINNISCLNEKQRNTKTRLFIYLRW